MSIYDEIASSQGVVYIDGPRIENLDRPVEFKSGQIIVFGKACQFNVQFTGGKPAFQLHKVQNVMLLGQSTIIVRDKTAVPSPQEQDHGIGIRTSTNILVQGFTIVDVGGDAVYIGPLSATNGPSTHIRIHDISANRPSRNGCSITHAINCTVSEIKTSRPGLAYGNKGIVLEPSHSGQTLSSIRIGNCHTLDRAHGIHVQMMRGKTITALIEHCTAAVGGWAVRCTSKAERTYDGKVDIIDCPGPHQVDWHGGAKLRIM